MKMYDVVVEIKNIQAESEEEAKKQALDLIVSPFPANIKIEAFEKRDIWEGFMNVEEIVEDVREVWADIIVSKIIEIVNTYFPKKLEGRCE